MQKVSDLFDRYVKTWRDKHPKGQHNIPRRGNSKTEKKHLDPLTKRHSKILVPQSDSYSKNGDENSKKADQNLPVDLSDDDKLDQISEDTQKLIEINSQNLEDNDSISLNSHNRSNSFPSNIGASFSDNGGAFSGQSAGASVNEKGALLIVDAPEEDESKKSAIESARREKEMLENRETLLDKAKRYVIDKFSISSQKTSKKSRQMTVSEMFN